MRTKEPAVRGEVLEELSGGRFRIAMESDPNVSCVCYLSGKMKFNHIRVMIGDTVEVVIDPYGGNATNRIVKRL